MPMWFKPRRFKSCAYDQPPKEKRISVLLRNLRQFIFVIPLRFCVLAFNLSMLTYVERRGVHVSGSLWVRFSKMTISMQTAGHAVNNSYKVR